jgi:hypothetical protein
MDATAGRWLLLLLLLLFSIVFNSKDLDKTAGALLFLPLRAESLPRPLGCAEVRYDRVGTGGGPTRLATLGS